MNGDQMPGGVGTLEPWSRKTRYQTTLPTHWHVTPTAASVTTSRSSGSARRTAHQATIGTTGIVSVKTRLSADEGAPANVPAQYASTPQPSTTATTHSRLLSR